MRPATAAQPTQPGDAKLNKMLAGIKARGTGQRFKNIELELFEWPGELHEKLGKMEKFAFVARPVEKVAGKLPLIIYLHGGGQRWWDLSLQEQLAILRSPKRKMLRGFDFAERAGKGLIVLEPNTAGPWDADALDTMLDYVLENFPEIDKDRVYVMGYSMGGKGTWVWINQSADRFAAAAIGGAGGGSVIDDVTKLVNLPLWLFVGGDDGPAAGMQSMVNQLRAAGNVNVKCTVFDGGHKEGGEGMFSTTVELVDWMLGFKRPKTTE